MMRFHKPVSLVMDYLALFPPSLIGECYPGKPDQIGWSFCWFKQYLLQLNCKYLHSLTYTSSWKMRIWPVPLSSNSSHILISSFSFKPGMVNTLSSQMDVYPFYHHWLVLQIAYLIRDSMWFSYTLKFCHSDSMLSNSSCLSFGILDPIHFKIYKMTLVSSLRVSFVLKSVSQVITAWPQDFFSIHDTVSSRLFVIVYVSRLYSDICHVAA